ncbi:hypothetical protein O6H91_03G051600 [Diphasiastrum complanatum]|uniref:Uncharacterized protein n=1 Tax=Diphasiastrum complanatum TaxID=34168 RepID=A0ACC2E666_DIPCM|nr:hypothetical protein O6H91_03G051600 [Diphasiastrum complanatum]
MRMTMNSSKLSFREPSMSMREVSYSCGQCGYSLNLNSSNRFVSNISKKYAKKSRKGLLSFSSIDESRFRLLDEFKCGPYFETPLSWGLHRVRTKLLCGKCGALVGYVKENAAASEDQIFPGFNAGARATAAKKFQVQIRALQPEETVECLDDSKQSAVEAQVKKFHNGASSLREKKSNDSTAVKKEVDGSVSTPW